MTVVIGAVGWSILTILISQGTSIVLMWWLGLPPKKLVHEIEEVQNPAVGACFFIVSLVVSFFVSQFVTNGYTQTDSFFIGAAWIVGALLMGAIFMWLSFMVAHRVMGRENDETVLQYIQRELIEEQNASLAFFLGGLAVVSFISVIYQVI